MKKGMLRLLAAAISAGITASCFTGVPIWAAEEGRLNHVEIAGTGNTTEEVWARADIGEGIDQVMYEWELAQDNGEFSKIGEGESLVITNKLASSSEFLTGQNNGFTRKLRLKATPVSGGEAGEPVYSEEMQMPQALGPRNIGESRITDSYQENAPEENVFRVDDSNRFILLDTMDNDEAKFFVFSCSSFGHSTFDPDAMTKYDPDKKANIAEIINRLVWPGTVAGLNHIPESIKNHAAAVDWKTEGGNIVAGNTPDDYLVKGQKTCLLSFTEFMKYRDKIGSKDDLTRGWWLRTPQGAWYTGTTPDSTQTGMMIGIAPANFNNNAVTNSINGTYPNTKSQDAEIRLAFYLDRGFFLDSAAKISVSDMGENVRLALADTYSKDELLTIYTPAEVSYITGEIISDKPVVESVSIEGSGETATELTAKAILGENAADVQYQWEVSTDNKTFSAIADAANQTVTVTNAMASYNGTVLAKVTRYVRVKATPLSEEGLPGEPVYSQVKQMPFAWGPRSSGEARQSGTFREYASEDDMITVGEAKFIVLDAKNDDIFVLSADSYGLHAFDTASGVRYNTDDKNNIGYYIKNTVWNGEGEKIIPQTVKEHAKATEWKTEAGNLKLGNATNDYIVKEPVCLLSFSEFMQYRDKIGAKDSGNTWWLRTPQGAYAQGTDAGSYQNMMVVFTTPFENDAITNSFNCNSYGANAGLNTRLAMHLDREFFLDAKIPVSNLGKNVRKAMAEIYTYDELRTVYSRLELNVYFGMAEFVIEKARMNGTKVTVDLKSSAPNDENCLLIAAIYENESRKLKTLVSKSISCGKNQASSFELTLNEIPADTDKVRIMLWSDWQEMTPLAPVYTIPQE